MSNRTPQNNQHNTTESTKKMSNTTPQKNYNTTESTKKMSNMTPQKTNTIQQRALKR